MVKVIGVRFKEVGKVYYFAPGDMKIEAGQTVIVETARGIESGEVVFGIKEVTDDSIVPPLKSVIRVATEDDHKTILENIKKEQEAFDICREKIEKHNLEMKLIDVEYTFDGSKIMFYFTADGRIDFRELVKDLAYIFKTRIELRQIGVRDEAKMLGGVGICGRTLCCKTFLGEFQPVSIKMAKEQGMSLNPTKISGNCGRLMCCLKYEQEAYEDLLQKTPEVSSVVKTPDGKGTVEQVNLLKGLLKVKLTNGKNSDSTEVREYNVDDVKVIHRARGMSRSFDDGNVDENAIKRLEGN